MLETDASAAYITDKERGTTALHMAARQGRIDIMEEIISYCPSCCEIVDSWNFLHFALVTVDAKELLTVVFGAESKIKDLTSIYLWFKIDINGSTPLHVLRVMDNKTEKLFLGSFYFS
ncbi:hypothetical protein DITRI_Ditri15bG0031300 [Diplodiscus trichospermus]